jgi:hypothetical protein
MNNIKNRAEEIVLNEYIYEASIWYVVTMILQIKNTKIY